MVDATEAAESRYLTPEIVDQSESQICVIVNGGQYEKGEYGRRLKLTVNIDQKEKIWNVNRESAKNLIDSLGSETDKWVGYKVKLKVEVAKNQKRTVIGKFYGNSTAPQHEEEETPTEEISVNPLLCGSTDLSK